MLVVAACAAVAPATARVSIKTASPSRPGGGSGGPVTADFQSIQDNVFTPICSKCHIGASAPEGLQLDAAHSYNLLVGVPSAERPDLLRVNPGNPDASYMVQKIEGAPGIIGGQMPLMETPLPQATIDAIRQWITNGAPNAAAASPAATACSPSKPRRLSIRPSSKPRCSESSSPSLKRSTHRSSTIRRSALERIASPESDAVPPLAATTVPVSVADSRRAKSRRPVDYAAERRSMRGVYRATLRGTGGGALGQLNATTLGADISFEFTVDTP